MRFSSIIGLKVPVILSVLVTLAGYATPYVPPRADTPVPPGWLGASGVQAVPGTITIHSGTHAEGDVILEFKAKFVRTGTVAETVKTKNAYGTEIILPKGAKAFAEHYVCAKCGGNTNPIQWCVILPDGIDGKGEGSQTVCAFWENENQARYLEDFRKGGFPYHVFLEGQPGTGTPGPVPQIVEGPVDFGVTLTRRVRISGIRWFGLVLQPELTDGTGTAIEGDPAYRWKETDGKKQAVVPLGAVVLVVTSSQDRNSVTVEPALVKPPTPPGQKTSEQKTP